MVALNSISVWRACKIEQRKYRLTCCSPSASASLLLCICPRYVIYTDTQDTSQVYHKTLYRTAFIKEACKHHTPPASKTFSGFVRTYVRVCVVCTHFFF